MSKEWSSLVLCFLIAAYFIVVVHSICSSHQFECNNGRCIPLTWHCDEDDDCGDGSDETACEARTCSETEFKCANQKCVPFRWQCDDEDDCGDKSDEDPNICQNKTCAPNQFSCAVSGVCIPITWRCDGQDDCSDGSDEKTDCQHITCTEEEFTCSNNKCITQRWLCDQDNDCEDGSDEKNCPNVTCSASESMCANGKCIPQRWRCDGDADCTDKSDEVGCPTTTVSSVMCTENEFMCHSLGCIHLSWVCDGEDDCPDKSDEVNCTIVCKEDQFQCQNKHCIPGKLQCDGSRDCRDGSDEKNCPSTAPKGCDPETQFECGANHCIPLNLVCNGKNDCGAFEDEPMGCNKNECKENNGGCSQRCVDTAVGFHCECNKGYRLVDDNRTCEDVNECEVPGSCSQLCDNTKGGFKCSCLPGYSLEPSNHHRCKAQEGGAAVLFSNRHDIRRIDLETLEYTSVVSGLRGTVALDYDFSTQTLFWTDVTEETIYSAPIKTGSPVTVVVSEKVNTPDGIAVDWIHNNIYWTDTGKNTIEMADMSGKLRKTLISKDLDEPRAIVLNPFEGWMFWSDWGEPTKIERAGMDGSQRRTIISSDIKWPNGLAIDFVSRRIFWADAKLHILCSADYDGSNQRVILFSASHVKHPFSLDVFEDWLYWSDWESEAIHRVNKFTGQDFSNIIIGVYSPMHVRVFHSYKQHKGKNDSHCTPLNGHCSHLCLPAPQLTAFSAKFTCACPDGMELMADMKTCNAIVTTTTASASSTAVPLTSTLSPSTPATAYSSSQQNKLILSSSPIPVTTSYAISQTPSDSTVASKEVSTTSYFNSSDVVITESTQIGANESFSLHVLNDIDDDSGYLAGIIIGCLGILVAVFSVFGFCIYKNYLRRNVTSMNFDNPVYRKTTEDQFSLEKNQYQPARSYPPSLEPLTSPGTNEFV